jgi:hypothetical protein
VQTPTVKNWPEPFVAENGFSFRRRIVHVSVVGAPNRVTRLVKFLLLGQLLTMDSVLKTPEEANFLGLHFPHKTLPIKFGKMSWATFWAILSQTHLVAPAQKRCQQVFFQPEFFFLRARARRDQRCMGFSQCDQIGRNFDVRY